MKHSLFLPFLLFLCSLTGYADYPSSLPGIQIPNSHFMLQTRKGSKLYRGAQPLDKFLDLKKLNITHVVIFKNDTRGEVEKEISHLQTYLKLKDENILHLPMPWKDEPFVNACKMTLRAYDYIVTQLKKPMTRTYFHCSVGEDRTGMLSGLLRVGLQNWTIQQAYQKEVCAHGFAFANSGKPKAVAKSIHDSLVPVYVAVSHIIQKAKAQNKPIKESECEKVYFPKPMILPFCQVLKK